MKKLIHILFSAALLLVLFGVCFASIFGEREEISEYEYRNLAYFPAFTWESFWDGSYAKDIDRAVDDHIYGRDSLMKAATWLDLKLGRPTVNRLVITPNGGPLVNEMGFINFGAGSYREETGERLAALREQITDYGGYLLYVGVPTQDSYFSDAYPDYMVNPRENTETRFEEFSALLEKNDVPFLNMDEIFLSQPKQPSLYFYTDHHYNYYGALLTYRSILARVNQDTGYALTILQDEDLEFHTLENPVLGSRNRKLYGLGEAADRLMYATPLEAISFEREDTYFEANGQIFVLPETTDEYTGYTVYMGNDIPETIIRTNREELPNCLIFGESFTNAVETMTWTAFNETRSLDLRFYHEKTLKEYLAEYKPDVVICIMADDSFYKLEGNGYYGD